MRVVYWDDLLETLFRNDPESARAVRAESVLWQQQRVILRSAQTAYLAGHGFSVGRAGLLDILAQRATDLGIDLQYRREGTSPAVAENPAPHPPLLRAGHRDRDKDPRPTAEHTAPTQAATRTPHPSRKPGTHEGVAPGYS